MKDIPLSERIILALDVESAEQAKELVRKTESHIHFYKVGLQLFMASWFNIVDWLSARGHKVMVDLKFFDIPETVKLAVAQLNSHQVTFATIHGNDPISRDDFFIVHEVPPLPTVTPCGVLAKKRNAFTILIPVFARQFM